MKNLSIAMLACLSLLVSTNTIAHEKSTCEEVGTFVAGVTGILTAVGLAGTTVGSVGSGVGGLAAATVTDKAMGHQCQEAEDRLQEYKEAAYRIQLEWQFTCQLNPNAPICQNIQCSAPNPNYCNDMSDGFFIHANWYNFDVDFRKLDVQVNGFLSILHDRDACGGECSAGEIMSAWNMSDAARLSYFTSLRVARGGIAPVNLPSISRSASVQNLSVNTSATYYSGYNAASNNCPSCNQNQNQM